MTRAGHSQNALPARWLVLAVLASVLILTVSGTMPLTGYSADCPSDEILVHFASGTDPAIAAARHGATIRSSIPDIDVYVLGVPSGTAAAKITEFQADPEVVY